MKLAKIVVVDDEPEITDLLELYLTKEGYDVYVANNGDSAVRLTQQISPDLIILDVLLPGMDGIETCMQLRKRTNAPILFVSCKSDDMDIISGLSIGGDDYITKPFSPRQLVARVKAHLRRQQMSVNREQRTISYFGLEIDLDSHVVRLNGNPVSLSGKEFDLLVTLASAPNRVLHIDTLYEMIWGSDSLGDTRTLMVHISNLRKKIEADPTRPQYIVTVRGVGYKFNAPG